MRGTQREKGKAIFVDGASANVTKAALGIETYDFHGLYDVLVNQVGMCRTLVGPPVITVHPERAPAEGSFVKGLTGAGFEVVAARSETGADDEAIKTLLRDLNPKDVEEIVIFTSDKDFIPILRSKASQKVNIYWVATKRHQPDLNRHRLSLDVIMLCTTPRFTFVEIADFTEVIGFKRSAASTPSPTDILKTLTYVLEHNPNCPSPFLVRLVGSAGVIDFKAPGLTADILGYGNTFEEAAEQALAKTKQLVEA